MSQPEKTKKRKHAHPTVDATADAAESSTKRSKGDKVKKDQSKRKSKGKEVAAGEFRVVQATLPLSIPPVFANKLWAGAEEMLDSMLMRCASLSRPRGVSGCNEIDLFLEDISQRCRELYSPTTTYVSLTRVPPSRRIVPSQTVALVSRQRYGAHMLA